MAETIIWFGLSTVCSVATSDLSWKEGTGSEDSHTSPLCNSDMTIADDEAKLRVGNDPFRLGAPEGEVTEVAVEGPGDDVLEDTPEVTLCRLAGGRFLNRSRAGPDPI